jgi:hypothetical protein
LPIVGNDVVDLTDPGNIGKGSETRFIERVCTPLEQKHVLNSAAMDLALWSLWAGKEAAYKVITKIHPDAVSTPKRYEVFLEDLKTGWTRDGFVTTPHGRIDIRVSAAEQYLHCLAVSPQSGSLDHLVWSVQPLPPDREGVTVNPSLSVRQAVSRHLSVILQVSSGDIEIRRCHPTSGCRAPVVYCQGARTAIDLSISHDGAFIAYAFSLAPL